MQPPPLKYYLNEEIFEGEGRNCCTIGKCNCKSCMAQSRVACHLIVTVVSFVYAYFMLVVGTLPFIESYFEILFDIDEFSYLLIVCCPDIMIGIYCFYDNARNFNIKIPQMIPCLQAFFVWLNIGSLVLFIVADVPSHFYSLLMISYHCIILLAYVYMFVAITGVATWVKQKCGECYTCCHKRCGKFNGKCCGKDEDVEPARTPYSLMPNENEEKWAEEMESNSNEKSDGVNLVTRKEYTSWKSTSVVLVGDSKIGKTRFLRSLIKLNGETVSKDYGSIDVNVSKDLFYNDYHLNQRYFLKYINETEKIKNDMIFDDTVGDIRFYESNFDAIEHGDIVMAMYYLSKEQDGYKTDKTRDSVKFLKELDSKCGRILEIENKDVTITCLLVGVANHEGDNATSEMKENHEKILNELNEECKCFKFQQTADSYIFSHEKAEKAEKDVYIRYYLKHFQGILNKCCQYGEQGSIKTTTKNQKPKRFTKCCTKVQCRASKRIKRNLYVLRHAPIVNKYFDKNYEINKNDSGSQPQSHSQSQLQLQSQLQSQSTILSLSPRWSADRWYHTRSFCQTFLKFLLSFLVALFSPIVLVGQACLFWLYSDTNQVFSNEFVTFVLNNVNVDLHNGIALYDLLCYIHLNSLFFPDPEIRHLIGTLNTSAFGDLTYRSKLGFIYSAPNKWKISRLLISLLITSLTTMSTFNVIVWCNRYRFEKQNPKLVSMAELMSGPIWLAIISSLLGMCHCDCFNLCFCFCFVLFLLFGCLFCGHVRIVVVLSRYYFAQNKIIECKFR